MKVGVYVFATDLDLDPGPLALEVEQRGFDSKCSPDHSHIPVARATAYPEQYGGGELPDFYKRTYGPFISCYFAAASTKPSWSARVRACSPGDLSAEGPLCLTAVFDDESLDLAALARRQRAQARAVPLRVKVLAAPRHARQIKHDPGTAASG